MSYTQVYNPCDDCPYSYSKNGQEMTECAICEFKAKLNRADKIIKQLEEELRAADTEKERTAKEDVLQFDSAKGYAHGIANALKIARGGVE